MELKKRTPIADLGEFGLIDRIAGKFTATTYNTIKGIGDDAAVIAKNDTEFTLLSTEMFSEGVSFDLVYFPLRHLGWKVVVSGINDVLAMNGMPEAVMVSVGLSSKFTVEDVEELYEGVRSACDFYGIDLIGGDTAPSVNGLNISVIAVGTVQKEKVTYRSGAKPNDLICVTSDLGAAYMGLHLLEREKKVFVGDDSPQPDFAGKEYLLEKYLRPKARLDIIKGLDDLDIVPTSMIDLSDGLASDLIQICKSSAVGARIYMNRLPIARETYAMAEELNADPVVAALNGGDDQELMFTVPLEHKDTILKLGGIDIVGHIAGQETGIYLVSPDGSEIAVTAPGFK